jgi:uncharacterized protein YgiM (DUF1202 family)
MLKKRWYVTFSCFLAICLFYKSIEAEEVLYITSEIVNVRSGPGTQHEKTEQAFKSEKLILLGKSSGWINVKLPNGQDGWIAEWLTSKSILKTIKDFEKLNIVKEYGFSSSENYIIREGDSRGKKAFLYKTSDNIPIEVMLGKNTDFIESFGIVLPSTMSVEKAAILLVFIANTTDNQVPVKEAAEFIRGAIDGGREAERNFNDFRMQVIPVPAAGICSIHIFPPITPSQRRSSIRGIGVSRNQVLKEISRFSKITVDNSDRIEGISKDYQAEFEFVGSSQNIQKATFSINLPFSDMSQLITNARYMYRFFDGVDPNWTGSRNWVSTALERIEYGENVQTLTRGNNRYRLVYQKGASRLVVTVEPK